MEIRMINSVGDLVAGESYEVPDEEADRFIVLGYAEGDLSREHTAEEIEEIKATAQEVSV